MATAKFTLTQINGKNIPGLPALNPDVHQQPTAVKNAFQTSIAAYAIAKLTAEPQFAAAGPLNTFATIIEIMGIANVEVDVQGLGATEEDIRRIVLA